MVGLGPFGFGFGVGDDPTPGSDRDAATIEDRGADQDARIDAAVVAAPLNYSIAKVNSKNSIISKDLENNA